MKLKHNSGKLTAAIFMIAWLFGSASAANCNCSPEIENASAKTTNACSKIWADDHCTLKETGAGETAQAFLPGDVDKDWNERLGYELGGTVAFSNGSYGSLREGRIDIDVLNTAIRSALNGEVPIEFAADVLTVMDRHKSNIEAAWYSERGEVFSDRGVTLTVGAMCLYAEAPSESVNFYINYSDTNSGCGVLPR